MGGYGYIGQAGTGKTTELIKRVEDSIDFDMWPESASILAITFMHGSRRRLENKLKFIQRKGVKISCQTIDSFCLSIFKRYMSYLGINGSVVVSDNPNEHEEHENRLYIGIHGIREKASELLDLSIVKEVLSFSYPIVVVDEFQDCEGALLHVIQKLSSCCKIFVAADDFQKLDNSTECPAHEWLSETLELKKLEIIWRTNNVQILDTAKALRKNEATKNGIKVVFAPSKDFAAYVIMSNMQWYDKMGRGGNSVATISPVGPHSDPFVQQTLRRLHSPMERMATKKRRGYRLEAEPFQIESENRLNTEGILDKCAGWDIVKVVTKEVLESWSFDMHPGFEIAVKRAKRIMKLRNTEELSKIEFSGLVSSGIHFINTFLTRGRNSRIFLTVHGAKNREFDDVFILWPKYTLPPEELYLRKLMYNAITRAKRKVVLIIQGNEKRRLECPLKLII